MKPSLVQRLQTCLSTHQGFLLLLILTALWRGWFQWQHSLDWDELNTLAQAQLPLDQLWEAHFRRDFSLPGSHILLHFWILLFGGSDASYRTLGYIVGLLSFVCVYGLTYTLTQSRKLGGLTTLFFSLSPLIFEYQRMSTKHSFYLTGVLASWWLFLNYLKKPTGLTLFGYGLTSLISLYQQPIGPLFLIFQAGFIWASRKTASLSHQRKPLLICLCLLGVLFLPALFQILRPGFASHIPEITAAYTKPSFSMLFWSPSALLFWGGKTMPEDWYYWIFGVGLYAVLWKGIQHLQTFDEKQPDFKRLHLVYAMGLLPIVTLFIVSSVMNLGAFQYRAILFVAYPLCLLLAFFCTPFHSIETPVLFPLDSNQKGLFTKVAILVLLGGYGCWHFLTQFVEDPYRDYASVIRNHWKAGDGIVLNPGFHYLGLLRYLKPELFEISRPERAIDPNQNSIFRLVNYTDSDLFCATGEMIWAQPAVQNQYLAFEKAHPRLWIIGPPPYPNHADCQKIYLTLQEKRLSSGQWEVTPLEIRCASAISSKIPEGQCIKPLESEQWQCSGTPKAP